MKKNFIQKPALTVIVLILIVLAVIYLQKSTPKTQSFKVDKETNYIKAPEIAGISKWINSEPLTLDDLKGKVILLDFWTYTCINCIRTLPYLNSWHEKYADKGLVIIGVHSPEFDFEKKYENVLNAVNQYEIKYPVAQDNNFQTWYNYNNRFWPHEFLIDINGKIRYDHIGEGNYDETEKMIQELLKERNENINNEIINPKEAVNIDFLNIGTPEIYLGYKFSRGNFGNEEGIKANEIINYSLPMETKSNNVYLEGEWKNNEDNMELNSNEGQVVLKFQAKNANIVAGSENNSEVLIYLDNNLLNNVKVKDFNLYNVVNKNEYGIYTLNMKVNGKGFKLYTFTFG